MVKKSPFRPCLYGLLPFPFNQGIVENGITQVSSEQAEGPDGILLPAGGKIVEMPINTLNGLWTRVLFLRLAVHNPAPDTAQGEGSRGYNVDPTGVTRVLPQTLAGANAVVPWASWVQVEFIYNVRASRYAIGGQASTENGATVRDVPAQASSFEHTQDGFGVVQLKGVVPPNGQLLVRARNTHPEKDLRINGFLHSYVFAGPANA